MNMRNTGLVIKYEIVSMLRKPSFWLFTFGFPVMILAFTFFPQMIAQRSMAETQDTFLAGLRGPAVPYVDLAGVIVTVPDDMQLAFKAFADEESAKAALRANEIAQYYLIPADFRETGRVLVVTEQPSLLEGMTGSDQLESVLRLNLAGSSTAAAALANPIAQLEEMSLAPEEDAGPGAQSEQEELISFLIPFAVMFILFFVITMSAGYMLQSVAREKENRTAELLLTSLSPRELMFGKVVGLGLVALVQMGIWLGGGQILLAGGALAIAALTGKGLSLSFFVWAVLFFVFGYIAYAAALGALGALAPTMREGSQFTFILLLPLMVPLWLNNVFANDPNGPIATALSFFPLSAPTTMVTRLAAGGVPAWQPFVALAGLVATAYLFVLLAARFFRADTLLSATSLSWGRIAAEVRGK